MLVVLILEILRQRFLLKVDFNSDLVVLNLILEQFQDHFDDVDRIKVL